MCDLNAVNRWSTENKMIINTTKTKSMLITGNRIETKLQNRTLNLRVEFNNIEVAQVMSHKRL